MVLDWVWDWRLDLVANKFMNLDEVNRCIAARSWLNPLKAAGWKVVSSRPGVPGNLPPIMHLQKNGIDLDFTEDHTGTCVDEVRFTPAIVLGPEIG